MNTFFGFEVVGSFRLGVCFFHLSFHLDPFVALFIPPRPPPVSPSALRLRFAWRLCGEVKVECGRSVCV